MSEATTALGVVLAGGAGRRLGGDKAAVVFRGRPLVRWPLAALERAGLDAVVVAKADSALPELDVERWDEPDEPRHPLCGLVAALRRADGPIVALACDMPLMAPRLVELLARPSAARGATALVPAPGGRLEPLAARYEQAALGPLAAALEDLAPLREAVAGLSPATLSDADLAACCDPVRAFANVNSPADLARLAATRQPPAAGPDE